VCGEEEGVTRTEFWRKLRATMLWCTCGGVICGSVVGYVLTDHSPLRLGLMEMLGRSPRCPFPNAARAAEHVARIVAARGNIVGWSHTLKTDPEGYVLWHTPHGNWWLPKGDGMSLVAALAEQELQTYGTGERFVRPGDIVLDCRADVGVFAHAALAVGARLVVAIEPNPANVECLRRNLREPIAAGRLVVHPKKVWDTEGGTLNVAPKKAASPAIQQEGTSAKSEVPFVTIDNLVGELRLSSVDFIKMDVQGAEENALMGARATLAKFRPRLVVSTLSRPDDPERIWQLVRKSRPEYRVECGPCAEGEGGIQPRVLFFY